jgi:MHS family proline/betaine transporter-like MFS transporter
LPSLLSEQFPVDTRAIGVALSFSTAVSIFGGLAPLIATSLIAATSDSLSPSYYLIFTALLSLAALIAIQARRRARLREVALARA